MPLKSTLHLNRNLLSKDYYPRRALWQNRGYRSSYRSSFLPARSKWKNTEIESTGWYWVKRIFCAFPGEPDTFPFLLLERAGETCIPLKCVSGFEWWHTFTFTLWRWVQLQLAMLPRISVCTSPSLPADPTEQCRGCPVQLPLLPWLWVEHLRCSHRKALAAFLERGTDPNIAKARFPTLVAS